MTKTRITDPLTVTGRLRERLEVWAADDDRVIVEIIASPDCVNAHLTIEQAEQHVRHMQQQIAAAKRLRGPILRVVP